MKVALKSCGNPDHGQDPDRPYLLSQPDRWVIVSSYTEASRVCREFIIDNDLGGGNWSGGQIFVNDEQIGQVNYGGGIRLISGEKVPL